MYVVILAFYSKKWGDLISWCTSSLTSGSGIVNVKKAKKAGKGGEI
ncbi:hypothetical protein IJG21_03450 [Candidatus Saccharibacteria bacterium]|nr:hypothetical protein [Candidatus Saccharibacteria bacterium]